MQRFSILLMESTLKIFLRNNINLKFAVPFALLDALLENMKKMPFRNLHYSYNDCLTHPLQPNVFFSWLTNFSLPLPLPLPLSLPAGCASRSRTTAFPTLLSVKG